MLSAIPDCDIENVLGEALAGLSYLPNWLGFESYVLAFKRAPRCLSEACGWPSCIAMAEVAWDLMDDAAQVQEVLRYLSILLKWWDAALPEIQACLLACDEEM